MDVNSAGIRGIRSCLAAGVWSGLTRGVLFDARGSYCPGMGADHHDRLCSSSSVMICLNFFPSSL
jgi:hypothetical protein